MITEDGNAQSWSGKCEACGAQFSELPANDEGVCAKCGSHSVAERLEPANSEMTPKVITFGNGAVKVGAGSFAGVKCLTLKQTTELHAVGSLCDESARQESPEESDVILEFKSIESAIGLREMLSELVCDWARENAENVDQ